VDINKSLNVSLTETHDCDHLDGEKILLVIVSIRVLLDMLETNVKCNAQTSCFFIYHIHFILLPDPGGRPRKGFVGWLVGRLVCDVFLSSDDKYPSVWSKVFTFGTHIRHLERSH